MKVTSGYGSDKTPKLVTITTNKTTKCHYCNPNVEYTQTGNNVVWLEKGERVLQIIHNAGPTGTSHICMKHAEKLREEINSLLG
jgi:hypothetical protein